MFGNKARRLARENAALREALQWYATSSNWRRKGVHAKGEPVKWVKSPCAFDRGARAKFILTQLDGPKAFFGVINISGDTAMRLPLAPLNTTDTE